MARLYPPALSYGQHGSRCLVCLLASPWRVNLFGLYTFTSLLLGGRVPFAFGLSLFPSFSLVLAGLPLLLFWGDRFGCLALFFWLRFAAGLPLLFPLCRGCLWFWCVFGRLRGLPFGLRRSFCWRLGLLGFPLLCGAFLLGASLFLGFWRCFLRLCSVNRSGKFKYFQFSRAAERSTVGCRQSESC